MRAVHYEPKPWNMDLDDLGDLSAPQGSIPWARAMRAEMAKMAKESTTDLRSFKEHLAAMERAKGYQQLDNEFGHPFASLVAFCVHRQPHGLGYDIDVVEAIQQETRQILLHDKIAEVQLTLIEQARAVEALQPRGTNQFTAENGCYNVTSIVPEQSRGNSRSYFLSLLKRDAPEYITRIEAGEFRSARAAAIVAGVYTPPYNLQWRTVAGLAKKLQAQLTTDERAALVHHLTQEGATPC